VYVIGPGTLSWAALYFGGLHPALALVPIVPLVPYSPRDLGVFDEREEHRTDTLIEAYELNATGTTSEPAKTQLVDVHGDFGALYQLRS
jgi:hypothetical protein